MENLKDHITIYEVAQAANVSLATVSRVINNSGTVKPETKEKVLQVIKQLGYKPSGLAQALATNKSTSIGVIIPSANYVYISNMLNGVTEVCRDKGFTLNLYTTSHSREDALSSLERVIKSRVDGVIVFDDELDAPDLEFLNNYSVPVININNKIVESKIGCIPFGYEHLIKKIIEDNFVRGDKKMTFVHVHNSGRLLSRIEQQFIKVHKENDREYNIVNCDDSYHNYFSCDNLVTYGFGKCDYRIYDSIDYRFSFFDGCSHVVKHNLIGRYNSYNLMSCIIVLLKMGFSMDCILTVIENIYAPSGRMEIFNYSDNSIIVDYAHTPDAIENVLSSISGYNKLYVVFGCTGNRDRLKRPIMTKLLLSKCDFGIITCDDLYDESFDSIVSDMLNGVNFNNYCVCYDRGEAIFKGVSMLRHNDILLVLGKGHESVIKIGSERIPFNDGECIRNIIKSF